MTKPLVIVAMPDEAAPFLEGGEGTPVDSPIGTVWDLDRFTLMVCGIGLTAAAAATAWAITTRQPSAVISAGTAGGLAPEIEVGDVAVSADTSYGSADATVFGYERGQVPGQPVRFPASSDLVSAATAFTPALGQVRVGRILSGDTFVTAANVGDMRSAFPDAVATDMESCAIAQTAAAFAVPFVSVRGISDLCGPTADQEHHLAVDITAARSRDAVLALLERLDLTRSPAEHRG